MGLPPLASLAPTAIRSACLPQIFTSFRWGRPPFGFYWAVTVAVE
jgi:hypothetical protein